MRGVNWFLTLLFCGPLPPCLSSTFTRQFRSSTTVLSPVVNKNHRQKEENRTIKIPVFLLLTSPNLYRVPRIYVPVPVARLLFRAFVCKLLLRFNRNDFGRLKTKNERSEIEIISRIRKVLLLEGKKRKGKKNGETISRVPKKLHFLVKDIKGSRDPWENLRSI